MLGVYWIVYFAVFSFVAGMRALGLCCCGFWCVRLGELFSCVFDCCDLGFVVYTCAWIFRLGLQGCFGCWFAVVSRECGCYCVYRVLVTCSLVLWWGLLFALVWLPIGFVT